MMSCLVERLERQKDNLKKEIAALREELDKEKRRVEDLLRQRGEWVVERDRLAAELAEAQAVADFFFDGETTTKDAKERLRYLVECEDRAERAEAEARRLREAILDGECETVTTDERGFISYGATSRDHVGGPGVRWTIVMIHNDEMAKLRKAALEEGEGSE